MHYSDEMEIYINASPDEGFFENVSSQLTIKDLKNQISSRFQNSSNFSFIYESIAFYMNLKINDFLIKMLFSKTLKNYPK